MSLIMRKTQNSRKKFNILFLSTNQSFFVDNHTNFFRMYAHLTYFSKKSDFNVIVMQPSFDKSKEKIEYKKDFQIYYYKQIKILGYTLCPFTDFNPFFWIKILIVLKKHKIDIIHIEFPFGIFYLKIISKTLISLNTHNVEYLYAKYISKNENKFPKFLSFLYQYYVYFIEKFALRFSANINAVSIDDIKNFRAIYNVPKEKIFLSTIGYREHIVNNPIDKTEARKILGITNDKFVVIFHGANNLPNREAIEFIKNRIAPSVKDDDILFLIAGNTQKFENTRNLNHFGYLENLKNFLYAADIAITPILRGTGMQTKILDYFSAKLPVLSTMIGVKGINFKDGKHGYIINIKENDVIEKIIELKNDPEKIKMFKKNIEDLIQKKFIWDNILGNLAERYKYIITNYLSIKKIIMV